MSHTQPVDRLTGISVPAEPHPLGSVDPLIACADLLSCPECGQDLRAQSRSLRCAHGHTFDIARQGYVSLLTGASTKMTGDTSAMLDARAAFQQAGHFTPIAAALSRTVTAEPLPPAIPAPRAPNPRADRIGRAGSALTGTSAARVAASLLKDRPGQPDAAPDSPEQHSFADAPAILEIGAGTGYYSSAVLEAAPGTRAITLDVAKPAVRRSARAHPRAAAVLADAWRGLPLRDRALAVVLSVFAPRNADEVARVLVPGGRFLVVTPTPRHLAELIGPLDMVSVDAAKDDRLAESLGARFELLDRTLVEYSMSLTHTDIANVAAMGPSAFHAAEQRADRIAALANPLPVTASVTIATYRVR